jgi:hypothetical protein
MGGRQVVRHRALDPVSKVRILPAQPVFLKDDRGAGVAITLRLFYFNGFTIYHEPTSRRA